MRSLLLIMMSLVGVPVQAALVDNGSYTTDTVANLDWLDLSITAGLSMEDALSSQTGWRYASNAEVEDLFWQLFPDYYDTRTDIHVSSSTSTNNGTTPYGNQLNDIFTYFDLFGITAVTPEIGRSSAYAYYFDEDDVIRSFGGQVVENALGGYNHLVQGLEYYEERDGQARSFYGTLLVRSTVVPIPAAIWLFGSALAGMGLMRRRQAA